MYLGIYDVYRTRYFIKEMFFMKKKLLVVIISAIMGLQLVGCGSSNDSSNKTTSDNKPLSQLQRIKVRL